MKLGEALNRRKQLAKEISTKTAVLREQAIRSSDDAQVCNTSEAITALTSLIMEKTRLEQNINRTNIATTTEFDGHPVSIMQLISERDATRLRETIYGNLASTIKEGLRRQHFRDREHKITTVTDFDLEAVERIQTSAAGLARMLDTKLQELNWTVDLVES